MWLACYTQEEIAEAVGLSQPQIKEILEELSDMEKFPKSIKLLALFEDAEFETPIYNIWSYGKLALVLKPMIAEKANKNLKLSQGRGKKGSAKLPKAIETREELAKEADISGRTLDKVEKIETQGIDELKDKADKGEISVHTAATIATEPKTERVAIGKTIEKQIGKGHGGDRRSDDFQSQNFDNEKRTDDIAAEKAGFDSFIIRFTSMNMLRVHRHPVNGIQRLRIITAASKFSPIPLACMGYTLSIG